MKRFGIVILLAIVTVAAGCSRQIVPPGHKGKVLNSDGYMPELLSTGKHWLWWWEDLVLLDLTTNVKTLPLKVTMRDYDPTSKEPIPGLDMDFVLSFRYRLKSAEVIIQTMFNDVKVDRDIGVTAPQILSIYGLPVIVTTFRDVVGDHTPEEAFANRGALSQKMGKALKARLATSPLSFSDVMVTKVTLPGLISQRISKNKDRELKITGERAKQAIALVKRENNIVLARKDAERDLIDAQAANAQNKELSGGITPEVLRLRELEIQKIYAEALQTRMVQPQQGDVVFLPYEAMQSVGAQVKMYNAK